MIRPTPSSPAGGWRGRTSAAVGTIRRTASGSPFRISARRIATSSATSSSAAASPARRRADAGRSLSALRSFLGRVPGGRAMAPARLPRIDELYAQHRERALRIARRVLGDPHEAEDVVQDVFVRLFAQPDRFDGRSAWTTWLHSVTVNGSINSLRARKRRDMPAPPPDAPPDPEELAVCRQMRDLFTRALEEVGGRHPEGGL